MTKYKSPGELVFGQDIIIPINNVPGWRYIYKCKQTQIDKDITLENTTRIGHDYKLGDKVMTKNRSSYKYENPIRGPYDFFQIWKNGTVTLRMGEVPHRINIRKHQSL